MPIQISDLFLFTQSRQKNELRPKNCSPQMLWIIFTLWPIRFGRIPKWNFGRDPCGSPPLDSGTQASQELIKSFGDKDIFMNGLLGCLLLVKLRSQKHQHGSSWHSFRMFRDPKSPPPSACTTVLVQRLAHSWQINPGMSWKMWQWLVFCFLAEDVQKHVVYVGPLRLFSYLISGWDLTIQTHLGSRLKSLAKQQSTCGPLDSLWPKTSQS